MEETTWQSKMWKNKSSGLDFAKVNVVRENIVKRIVSEFKKYTSNA